MKYITFVFLFLLTTVSYGLSRDKKATAFNVGFEKVKGKADGPANFNYSRDVISLDSQTVFRVKGIRCLKPIQKPAEKDTEFESGSGIKKIKTSKTIVENLKILGLVWGFLKYYDPAVAKGNYNWDYELFKILPKILNAGNSSARDNILVQWIKKLGNINDAESNHKKWKRVKMKPDLEWLTSSNISNELSQLLLKIKKAKRSGENYYVGFVHGAGNPIFKHEPSYKNMKYPDAGYRLLALYRYWNIIQYFYPYKYLIKGDWKNVLTEFIPQFIHAKDETEYILTTLKLIAGIHDTHATIYGNYAVLRKYFGERIASPDLIFIDNKAVVEGFYRNHSGEETRLTGEETGLKKGDIITKVNRKPVAEIVKNSLKISPASNYPTQLRNITVTLLRTNDSLVHITYLRNGTSHKKVLKTYPLKELNIYRKVNRYDTCFKMITPDIGYLYLGSLKSKYLPSIFKKLKHTKGLVIDLRCYPSESDMVYSLGKYLMRKPRKFAKGSHGSLEYPGLFTFFKNALKVGKRNKQYYKGKIVILVNEYTQSLAEFTAMAFRVAPDAIVIGSTTAGADGNISRFYLPGGISTAISGVGVYYPNGDETQRVGIVPDIKVKPTIEGIKKGKDEVLEKAIGVISK